MDIISRKEARQLGLTRYSTGKPCCYGHTLGRMVSNGHCIGCLRVSNLKFIKNYQRREGVREKYNEARVSSRLAIKVQVVNHYGGKCACCGEINPIFLNVDHINQDGAAHRKSMGSRTWGGKSLYRWLQKNNFPEGFRILCFNCNFAIYHLGVCPHQRGDD